MTRHQANDDEAAIAEAARQAVQLLRAAGATVATAESLTGGLLGAAITAVPGASHAYRGGVVAYATDLKHQLLGVDAGLLTRVGAVDAEVAGSMAEGARVRCGADYGVATTGVAGPDPQDGKAPGTVWIAVATPLRTWTLDASIPEPVGDRAAVRRLTVLRALTHLGAIVREDPPSARR